MKNWKMELTAGDKNPDKYIPGRCAINIIICDSDDGTQSHT